MNWYYSIDSERHGPVPADELASMARKGSLAADSLVWRDGLKDWTPIASVLSELGVSTTDVATADSGKSRRCVECGYLFPQSEVFEIGGQCVCGRCKPGFLEKISEGRPYGGANGVWRKGREMVVALEGGLPDRCVKCNADTPGRPRLKRDLYWHTPVLYLMILFPGLIFYALVAIFVRKRAKLHIGICDTHRAKRRNAIITSWTGIFVGIGAIVGGASALQGDSVVWTVFLGIILILASAIYGVVASRVVYPKKIDKTHAYVGGVCAAFLDQLPEWQNK